MRLKTRRAGFTLIELSLSMVFVGVLSLAIALIISDTIASYKRGLTLNQINTVGMDIVDDMRTAVQNSSGRAATAYCERYYGTNNNAYTTEGEIDQNGDMYKCQHDGAYSFIYLAKYSTVKINNKEYTDVPVYGAFCTGTYSYLWNSGYYEASNAEFKEKTQKEWARLTFDYSADGIAGATQMTIFGTSQNADATDKDNERPFRLLKVRDDYRAVCVGLTRSYDENNGSFDGTYVVRDGRVPDTYRNGDVFKGTFTMQGYTVLTANEWPVDVIVTDRTYDLALYNLYVPRPAESSTQKNALYSVSMILGTIGGGIDILAQGKSCAVPTDFANENFSYCAINRFNFAAQTGGE